MNKLILLLAIALLGCQKEDQKKQDPITIVITNIAPDANVVLNGVKITDTTRPLILKGKSGESLKVDDYQAVYRTIQINITSKPPYSNTIFGQFKYEENL